MLLELTKRAPQSVLQCFICVYVSWTWLMILLETCKVFWFYICKIYWSYVQYPQPLGKSQSLFCEKTCSFPLVGWFHGFISGLFDLLLHLRRDFFGSGLTFDLIKQRRYFTSRLTALYPVKVFWKWKNNHKTENCSPILHLSLYFQSYPTWPQNNRTV